MPFNWLLPSGDEDSCQNALLSDGGGGREVDVVACKPGIQETGR